MKSYTLYISALVSLLLLSGCHTSKLGESGLYYSAKSFKTKNQILKNLGGPMAVTKKGEDESLTYAYKCLEGNGIGLGSIVIGLFVSDSQQASDIITFMVGPDGKVKKYKRGVHATHTIENGFWPFD
jgi:hypothetical protein